MATDEQIRQDIEDYLLVCRRLVEQGLRGSDPKSSEAGRELAAVVQEVGLSKFSHLCKVFGQMQDDLQFAMVTTAAEIIGVSGRGLKPEAIPGEHERVLKEHGR